MLCKNIIEDDYVSDIIDKMDILDNNGEIDISNPEGVSLMKILFGEVIKKAVCLYCLKNISTSDNDTNAGGIRLEGNIKPVPVENLLNNSGENQNSNKSLSFIEEEVKSNADSVVKEVFKRDVRDNTNAKKENYNLHNLIDVFVNYDGKNRGKTQQLCEVQINSFRKNLENIITNNILSTLMQEQEYNYPELSQNLINPSNLMNSNFDNNKIYENQISENLGEK
jgi:hypothetical protein